jgi:hypothetical protein
MNDAAHEGGRRQLENTKAPTVEFETATSPAESRHRLLWDNLRAGAENVTVFDDF